MNITFIRHTSVNVPRGTCYGQTDVPLNASFPEEAAAVSAGLDGRSFDKVYTSPLNRCVRLAEWCGFPDAERDVRLLELNFGEWEMKRFDDISDPRLQLWYDDFLHVRATGGESFEDQRTRVFAFLDEVRILPYNQVAVFAHGGVLLCAGLYAGLVREEEAFHSLTPYGGMIEIEV